MLSNNSVFKTAPAELYTELDAQFGEEPWLTWEPETLLRHLPAITDPAMQDKVMAVQAVAGNLSLALSVSTAFENVLHAFSNNVCVMDAPQPVFVEEILYGVRQLQALAKLVHPEEEIEFIGEIPGYVSTCGHYYGWILLPTPLGFAQSLLNYLNGLQPESAKYKMFADHMQQIEKAALQLDEAELSGDDLSALDDLPEDSPLSPFILKVVGAYLFDPTQGDYVA